MRRTGRGEMKLHTTATTARTTELKTKTPPLSPGGPFQQVGVTFLFFKGVHMDVIERVALKQGVSILRVIEMASVGGSSRDVQAAYEAWFHKGRVVQWVQDYCERALEERETALMRIVDE